MSERPTGNVTFLFTDVEGSTRLWDAFPGQMSGALARHDEILRQAIGDRRGVVFSTAGDSFAAAFHSPLDAAWAAVAAQLALAAEDWGGPTIRVRMGIHSGSAEERDGDYFGPVLNRTARIMSAGHGGQVLVSEVAAAIDSPAPLAFDDLGTHRLKDLSEPQHLFQVHHPDLEKVTGALRAPDTPTGNRPPSRLGRGGLAPSAGEEGGTAGVQFLALGPLEVRTEHGDAVLGGPKQRAVLGFLLVRGNDVVSAEVMADAIWPDAPTQRALAILQVYVAKLRKGLGVPGVIETVRPGYRVQVTPANFDAMAFEAGVELSRNMLAQGRYAEAIGGFGEALARWRGRYLADLAGYDFVEVESGRLDHIKGLAEVDLLESHLGAGHLDFVIPEARRLISSRSLDERLHAIQMKALYRAGSQAEALAVFQRLRAMLVEELGIDPSPELRDLELRILEQDPGLMMPTLRDETVTVPADIQVQTIALLEVDGVRHEVGRAVTTIGRSADRGITIDDPKASRRHAEIRRLHDGFLLVDAGSANGTSVNGVLVSEHRLADSDRISIGDTELLFSIGLGSPLLD